VIELFLLILKKLQIVSNFVASLALLTRTFILN
jgi:hypothetical protein